MPDTSPRPRIAELAKHAGDSVTVRGWVTHVRSSGKVAFAVIRDGTGIMQAVFVKTAVPAEVWERFKELTLETSVGKSVWRQRNAGICNTSTT
jgi:asparaginyl-tRNA synthetase